MVPPDLLPATAEDLVPEADLQVRLLQDLDLAGRDGSNARLLECTVMGGRLDDVQLRGARIVDCTFEGTSATSMDALRSTWRDVTVTDCRFGALSATSSTLTGVTIRGGKIDFLNLRGSSVNRVTMQDCRIGELHLGGASLSSVALVDCRVDLLEMRDATASDVDLRGAELGGVDGVEYLRGARISEFQLQQLAPVLAAHLGMLVGDPPPAPRRRATLT